MKKNFLFLITIFMLFSNVVFADTEVVIDFSEGNETNKNITKVLPGTENSETEDTHFKLTSDKRIAYCSNGKLKNPEDEENAVWNNCQVVSDNNVSKSLSFIYENGYGSYKNDYDNSSYLVGNQKYTDYFITQVAIWHFMTSPDWFSNFNVINHTYNGLSNDNTIKISNLISDAEKAQEGPTLTMTSANEMSLSLNGDYYISKGISVSGTYLNSKITVLLNSTIGGILTDDVSGTENKTLFDNNSTIYVKIPVEKVIDKKKIEFELNASATSAIGSGKILECQYSGNEYSTEEIQNIIIYNPSNENLSDTIEYSVDTFEVKILKKDNKGKFLRGATLELKLGDKLIDSWVSGTEEKTISLLPGVYTLVESKTPKGYKNNKKNITFEVKSNGVVVLNNKNVEEIVVENDPIEIIISKKIINSDKELAGAILKITDEKGNVVKDINNNALEWETTGTPKKIHIAAGTYILEEVKAPEGYELSDKKIKFTVKADGTVTVEEGSIIKKEKTLENNYIVFENIPEPDDVETGDIVIYFVVGIGIIAAGTSTFIVLKKRRK